MKKFISLICCVAIIFSLTATVSFAETTNLSVSVSATEINVGDTVTVILKNSDMVATSVTGGFYFDKDLLTCDSITDARGRNPGVGYLKDDFDDWYKHTAFATVASANETGTVGFALAGTGDVNFVALNVATVVFTAKAPGTVNFSIYESTSGTDKVNVDGVNPVTLTIKGNDPDPTPAVPEVDGGALNQGEDADDKTWNVNISNGFVAAGDVLVATLTNSAKTGDEATQVVELNVGEGAVAGGADWSFKLKVRFFDLSQRATTSLSIAKKSN